MLYDVTFRCGHTRMVNLIGQYEERQRKILRYKNFVICPDCQAAHSTVMSKQPAKMWSDAEWARPQY